MRCSALFMSLEVASERDMRVRFFIRFDTPFNKQSSEVLFSSREDCSLPQDILSWKLRQEDATSSPECRANIPPRSRWAFSRAWKSIAVIALYHTLPGRSLIRPSYVLSSGCWGVFLISYHISCLPWSLWAWIEWPTVQTYYLGRRAREEAALLLVWWQYVGETKVCLASSFATLCNTQNQCTGRASLQRHQSLQSCWDSLQPEWKPLTGRVFILPCVYHLISLTAFSRHTHAYNCIMHCAGYLIPQRNTAQACYLLSPDLSSWQYRCTKYHSIWSVLARDRLLLHKPSISGLQIYSPSQERDLTISSSAATLQSVQHPCTIKCQQPWHTAHPELNHWWNRPSLVLQSPIWSVCQCLQQLSWPWLCYLVIRYLE